MNPGQSMLFQVILYESYDCKDYNYLKEIRVS